MQYGVPISIGLSVDGTSYPEQTVGFPVTIANNSGQAPTNVYVTLSSQNASKTAPTFYYTDFLKTGQPVPYPTPADHQETTNTVNTSYGVPLSELSINGDGTPPFRFIMSTINMVSGRVYLSLGQSVNIGLVNTFDGPAGNRTWTGVGLQSPPFGWAGQDSSRKATGNYPYDKVELSCTDALYANITNVDYFSFSMALSVTTKNTTLGPVGFGESRAIIMSDLISNLPSAFIGKATGQGNGLSPANGTQLNASGSVDSPASGNIVRVLAPNHVIDGGQADASVLRTYLDTAINDGWTYYGNAANQPAMDAAYNNSQIKYPADHPQFGFRFVYPGDDALLGEIVNNNINGYTAKTQIPVTSATQLVFYCTYCSDPTGLTGLHEVLTVGVPHTVDVFSNEGGSLTNAGTDGRKRLNSLIGAALTRGVFTEYANWGVPLNYYTTSSHNNGTWNDYSQFLHNHAISRLCYGFGYDDVYGQDPTLSTAYSNGNVMDVTITFNQY